MLFNRERNNFNDIKKLFSDEFYKNIYGIRGNSWKHFVKNYRSNKYDPCPEINLKALTKKYPDLSVEQLLFKLVQDKSFYRENRTISGKLLNNYKFDCNDHNLFEKLAVYVDEVFYYNVYPDVKASIFPAYIHYGLLGWKEGRRPVSWFDTEFYLKNNDDVVKEGVNPFIHYVEHGKKEGRSSQSLNSFTKAEESLKEPGSTYLATEFDPKYYIEKYPDIAAAGIDPYEHYIKAGENEGRCPNALFDPFFYKAINADVRTMALSPFKQFCEFGYNEGRMPSSIFLGDRSFSMKPLLFVGHDGNKSGSQVVLLEILKWFHFHTNRRLKILLLSPGLLVNEYAKYAETYVLAFDAVDDVLGLKEFFEDDFEFAYLNTVVAGKVFALLENVGLSLPKTVVTHVHEMEKVLEEFENEMSQLVKRTQHWISASPESTRVLRKNYSVNASDCTTIPAFIKPILGKEFNNYRLKARSFFGISDDYFVVVGCGTIYWRKGPDLFVDVAKKVKSTTKTNIKFIWIGDGPDHEKLQSTLSEDEKKYIKFVGSYQNANELIAAGDVFFLSSREDPFPLVVLEAAQHGIPSVCFRETTGITDFILNDAGLALKKVDANSAAMAIKAMLSNPEKVKEMGAVAKERVFEKYTSETKCLFIYDAIQKNTQYKPSVTVIAPFYNHERFIRDRIESIFEQTIKDIEVFLLDDCSSDGTARELHKYIKDPRVTVLINKKNSGSPFKQWKKGIERAHSDLIWIAEGDDTCEANFLKTLLPYFKDPMMNIASAKTEIICEFGKLIRDGLKPYLDMVFTGKFERPYIKDGFEEVNEQLGAVNTLVNASSLLIRKSSIVPELLKEAQEYKIAGDWLVYLGCLKRGKIAYDTNTTNYFRRHSASQVHRIEGTGVYFSERFRIIKYVIENFIVNKRLIRKAFDIIEQEWTRFEHKNLGRNLDDYFPRQELSQMSNPNLYKMHIALYVHGMVFSMGGIEKLAAQISNYLAERGWKVTILCGKNHRKTAIYPIYNSINLNPIFDENMIDQSVIRLRDFLSHSDIDIFLPMLSEWLFEPIIEAAKYTGIPIIVSEHNDPWKIEEHWWSKEKRLRYFSEAEKIHLLLDKFKDSLPTSLRKRAFIIPNGVNIPESICFEKREKLILGVGRLESQKCFNRLIEAVAYIQEYLRQNEYRVEIYGKGSLSSQLQGLIHDLSVQDLVFLEGQVSGISKIYEKADFLVIPSEFEGFPLVLLEAFSYGLPVIGFQECNGINEIIRNEVNGILVSNKKELGNAILKFCDNQEIITYRQNARNTAYDFSIEKCLEKWEEKLTMTFMEKP